MVGKSAGAGLSRSAQIAIQVGSIAAASAISARKAKSAAGQSFGSEVFLSGDPSHPREVIYGRAWTAGTLRYRNVAPPNNTILYMLIVLAGHECDSIEIVEADREALTLDGSGNVTSPAKWVGRMQVRFYLGTDAQTADSTLDTAFANWTTNHRLRGLTYAIVKLTYDTDLLNTPPAFRFLVKGRKVYDPRLDDTNGGSGAHRLATPSTWAWSDNGELCWNDYWRGVMVNGVRIAGPGIPSTRYSWPSVIAEANVCDESVALAAGGNQKRYTVNGIIDPRQKHGAVKAMFEQALAGDITPSDGKWRSFCGAFRAPSLALLPDHFVGPLRLKVHLSEAERRDTAHGRYAALAEAGSAIEYAPVSLSTAVVGSERVQPVDMQLVNDGTNTGGVYDGGARPQRICKLLLERDAAGKLLTCTTNLYGLRAMPGESIDITHAAFGLSAQTMRVMDWRPRFVQQEGGLAVVVDLTLQAGPASLYAWSAEETAIGASPALPQLVVPQAAGMSVSITASNGVQFVQAPDGGSWTPAGTTTDIAFVFKRNGADIASRVVRVTRSGAALTATLESNSGEATSHVLNGDGTAAVTIIATHTASGVSDAQAVSAVQGGDDGAPGLDGDDGVDAVTVGVAPAFGQWTQAPNDGAFTPSGTTCDITFTHYRAGASIATHVIRVTRSGTTLTAATFSESGEATAETIVGSGTTVLTALVQHTASGVTGAQAISVVEGGDDGAPGVDGDDGAAGLSVHTVAVFKRASSAPATPTGGSYDFGTPALTPPSGWSASPPASDGTPLWSSVATFAVQGTTGTDSSTTWSTPALMVADGLPGSNALNEDPSFQDITLAAGHWSTTGAADLSAVSGVSIPTVTDGKVGRRVLRINNAAGTQWWSEEIPLDVSRNYQVSLWARQVSGTPLNYLFVAFFDANGNNIDSGTSDASGWDALGSYHYWARVNQAFGTSFTNYSRTFGPNTGTTIPTGAVSCRIGSLTNFSASAAENIDFQDFRLTRLISLTDQIYGTLVAAFADNALKNAQIGVNADGSLTGAGGGAPVLSSLSGSVAVGQLTANVLAALQAVIGNLAAINANIGAITAGNITFNSSGAFIKLGTAGFESGIGFYVEYNGGTPRLFLGNAAGNYVSWDGSVLEIVGDIEANRSLTDWGPTQTFTPNWNTGFSTAPTGDFSYAVSVDGLWATMWRTADLTGTANAGTMTINNLPAAIRPAGSLFQWALASGACVNGSAQIPIAAKIWEASHAAAGTLEFGTVAHTADFTTVGLAVAGFVGAGTKGPQAGFRLIWAL